MYVLLYALGILRLGKGKTRKRNGGMAEAEKRVKRGKKGKTRKKG